MTIKTVGQKLLVFLACSPSSSGIGSAVKWIIKVPVIAEYLKPNLLQSLRGFFEPTMMENVFLMQLLRLVVHDQATYKQIQFLIAVPICWYDIIGDIQILSDLHFCCTFSILSIFRHFWPSFKRRLWAITNEYLDTHSL